MATDTPSSVMYTDLRQFGGIAHRDTATVLFDGSVSIGGKTLSARIDDRTFLSREIVHAKPGSLHPELFSDFPVAAKKITSRLIAARGGGQAGCSEVIAHYRGAAATCMCDALASNDIDAIPYGNVVRKIMSLHLELESDRALLLVMLFVIVGCLADPRAAIDAIDAFAASELATSLDTLVGDEAPRPQATSAAHETRLGLVRLVNGAFRPPIHELSCDPAGTIIGCLPNGPHSIADVDADVSRQHVRIWREDGRWLVTDLNSTNGTRVISGADKSVHIIAGPQAESREPSASEPFELRNSDILCLGSTTRFLVMKLSVG